MPLRLAGNGCFALLGPWPARLTVFITPWVAFERVPAAPPLSALLSVLVSALLSGPAGPELGGTESGNDAPELSRGPMPEPGIPDPIPGPAPIDPSAAPPTLPPPTGRRSCASASHGLSASHKTAAAASRGR